MKRTQLKSKEAVKLLEQYDVQLSKKDLVEIREDEYKILYINKKPCFFYYQDVIIPTLKYLLNNPNLLKSITVDMGAVKFVVNGADIMRPGITQIDGGIKQDEPIVIVDENNKKPLAIGISLLNGKDLQAQASGKHIKNIHYVGDDLWKLE